MLANRNVNALIRRLIACFATRRGKYQRAMRAMRVEALHLFGEAVKCTHSEDDAGCRLSSKVKLRMLANYSRRRWCEKAGPLRVVHLCEVGFIAAAERRAFAIVYMLLGSAVRAEHR
jgi:hypothetical protein